MPEDLAFVTGAPIHGRVEVPLHIRWSEPVVIYDMSDRTDRSRVYQQVRREGTGDDVRRFIDPDDLLDMFDDLVLPPRVRRAWADWFERHRGNAPAF